MELLRLIFISILFLIFSGCAGYMQKDADGNYVPPNFYDGTWSSCTYTSKDGAKTTPPPVQLGGAPMERTEPDGTGVKCVPMPAKITVPPPT